MGITVVDENNAELRPRIIGKGKQRKNVVEKPNFVATPKQEEFINAILSGKYRYLAIGGGIRGSKTYAVLAAAFLLCKMFPGIRIAIVRKDLPRLRQTTIVSFNKLRPVGFVGDINQSTWTSTCTNGSQIIFWPEMLQQDPDLDRWKGLEVNVFIPEEANELAEKSFDKSIERAGAWVIPATKDNREPVQPPPLILLTFNPANNWVKRKFYDPWRAGTIKPPFYFLPSTIADNPHMGDEYKESLKNLPEAEYRRFVQGDWEAGDDPDQLIKAEWVWNMQNVIPRNGKPRMAADIARFGDDNTVIGRAIGNAIVSLDMHENIDTYRTAEFIVKGAMEFESEFDADTPDLDPRDVLIDAIGLGAGVVDACRKLKFNVSEFIAGAKPIPRPDSFYKFKDLRSQAWYEFREKLRRGLISSALLEEIPEQLVTDLTSPRYTITGERELSVGSKKDIKERIGRSTDYGDTVVMMFFDLPPRARRARIQPTTSKRTMR